MYSCMVPRYCSSCNLSWAMFLSSNGAYWSMNMRSKSGNVAGTSPHTSRWSIQHAALPPIKATLYWHACVVSLPIYEIWTAMNYHFNVDNHIFTWFEVPVSSLGSVYFTEMATCIARVFYSGSWDGLGASCYYFAGINIILCCIIAASYICTPLGAIFF